MKLFFGQIQYHVDFVLSEGGVNSSEYFRRNFSFWQPLQVKFVSDLGQRMVTTRMNGIFGADLLQTTVPITRPALPLRMVQFEHAVGYERLRSRIPWV
jgi:hypothetical protein